MHHIQSKTKLIDLSPTNVTKKIERTKYLMRRLMQWSEQMQPGNEKSPEFSKEFDKGTELVMKLDLLKVLLRGEFEKASNLMPLIADKEFIAQLSSISQPEIKKKILEIRQQYYKLHRKE